MKLLVIFAVLFVGVFARTEVEYQRLFTNWMKQHKKTYTHDVFQTRYLTFKANQDFIDSWNGAGHSSKCAMNQFGDLSLSEYKKTFLGFKMPTGPLPGETFIMNETRALPVSLDWRTMGAVTHIKNQGQCGSCWSFSTTGSTEGCHEITTKSLVALSEQQLVDCSGSYGNQGCDGGLMTQAMQYIIATGGIDTESTYPYTAEDGTCQWNPANSGATLKSFQNVPSGNEQALQQATDLGPTSVAIDASHSSFQFYSSGVYYEPSCSSSQLDHGVLSIGWGVLGGKDYWLVKNSWGTSWGMNGYIYMSRNKNNNCGIATMATRPTC